MTNRLLTTTALAAVLALGGGSALAQQGQTSTPGSSGTERSGAQGASGAGQASNPAGQPLRQAEQSLRQAQQQLSGGGGNGTQQARQAVTQAQQALGQVPSGLQGQDAFRSAQRQLSEADDALKGSGGGQPNQRQAATQLGEAADAMASLQDRMGGANAASAGGSANGAQIAVEQRAPQVTVQQSQPTVTVQQPPPQVTVQQPRPQVTVRQPEPQVTVQQAQPQVTVERAGQPQVNMQRQGEPQVTVQREAQPQASRSGDAAERDRSRLAQQGQDATTGATATTAPAQSGSGMPLARVSELVGKNVVGANGQDAGEIQNLLMDRSGQVRGAVVEWGGFLGIGERQAVVPIERIQLGQGGNDRARLSMTRQELEALPRYDRNDLGEYGTRFGWGDGVRAYR